MYPTAAAAEGEVPGTALLYDDWYPALRVESIREKRLKTAMLLGIPLVLGRREDGRIFAMRDSCPHRGIPLSCGWFDGKQVTCKYHGWGFEPVTGQCLEIPSLTSKDTLDPHKIFAGTFPCEEHDGHAWVYVPRPGRGRLKTVDDLPRGCRRRRSSVRATAAPTSPPTCRAMSITASSD